MIQKTRLPLFAQLALLAQDSDAVSVCSALKANNAVKNIPVIIFSSDATMEAAAYIDCKAACFVLKGPRWLRGLSVALDRVLPSAYAPQTDG